MTQLDQIVGSVLTPSPSLTGTNADGTLTPGYRYLEILLQKASREAEGRSRHKEHNVATTVPGFHEPILSVLEKEGIAFEVASERQFAGGEKVTA